MMFAKELLAFVVISYLSQRVIGHSIHGIERGPQYYGGFNNHMTPTARIVFLKRNAPNDLQNQVSG